MIWECPALIEQRLRHVSLFNEGADNLAAFLQQDPVEVAAFVKGCYFACVEVGEELS